MIEKNNVNSDENSASKKIGLAEAPAERVLEVSKEQDMPAGCARNELRPSSTGFLHKDVKLRSG